MIDFDMMLVHVGEFGIYQKVLFLFQAPFAMFVTFVLFGQLFFYLYPRTYWCREHPCIDAEGLTPAQRRNLSVPWVIASTDYDPCMAFTWRPEQAEQFVSHAQESCTRILRQDPNAICDYHADTNGVFLVRPRRYASRHFGFGSSSPDEGYYNYGPSTNGYQYDYGKPTNSYKDGYDYTSPRPPLTPPTKKSVTDRTDNRDGRQGSKPEHTTPRTRSSTSASTASSNRTCPTLPVHLWLHQNVSVNAQSIANLTRPGRKGGFGIPSPPSWTRLVRCTNWTWNLTATAAEGNPPYPTIVTENPDGQWLCNPELRITIANAVFYVGAIVGGIGIGFIADSRGRVPALVTANVLGCVGGALSAVFYQDFYIFLVFRFITGMAFDNCFTMIYILVLEYVGPTYRTLVANLSIAVFYTIGTLILPGLAILIGNWRIYALAISLPLSLALGAICIVPESARWLLSKGRTREATQILRSFAKVNRKHVSEEIFVEFEDGANKLYEEFSQEPEPTLLEAFKKPRIARNFFFLTIIWALIALVYDGHSRNILNLGDNVFISFAIASSTEFPADMLVIFLLDRVGRRWLAFFAMMSSGGFSLVAAFVPQSMMTLSLVTALISRLFVNVAFNIGLQYAAELLPTVIRAQGVNVIHIMGYVASIVSPFIASLGRTNPTLSLTLLGILACTSGTLCLFLPETLGEDLPNTLEEGEEFGKHQSFWNCPLCAKPKPEDEEPMEPVSPTPVQRRNNMRASLRGETFRSSIISTSSSGRRITPTDHLLMNPGGSMAGHSKLRRVYTQ